jgi:hypothetical protein
MHPGHSHAPIESAQPSTSLDLFWLARGVRDSVSRPGDGLNDLRLPQFPTQSTEGDLYGLGEWVRVFVPHLVEQALRAHNSRGRKKEGFEDPEFLR